MNITEITIRIADSGDIQVWRRDLASEVNLQPMPQSKPATVAKAEKKPQAPANAEQQVFTRTEAAAFLRVRPVTVDRLRKRGLLRPNLATRRPLYVREELLRFLEEGSKTIDL